jgi:hypothetical protein
LDLACELAVLIFGLFLKRFQNFRQASGFFVSQIYATATAKKLLRMFIMFLFSFLFVYLANFFIYKIKNKNKKLLLRLANNLDKQGVKVVV